jgi:hypothetical protein
VRRVEASHRWGKLEQIAGERYSDGQASA